ncbi:hypothetical protein FA95DRAFT_1419837 [Auriscalpium vulgare]|uniref:Uncharacterized protein n=1 Tax=Auriscalpium vulgare TaxID=40419 RepID=A0ACB8RQD0_9AGAM|nr:hypothetical protein FA95DRAFT_1419837 [Auriscalpium vulgare]
MATGIDTSFNVGEEIRQEQEDPAYRDAGERWWVERYVALEQAGYVLRPRYHPNWKPSWVTNGTPRGLAEDGHRNSWRWEVIDAARRSDGAQVVLKQIDFDDSREIKMYKLFTSEPLASDPRNHTLFPHETLYLPEVPEPILVMPLGRPIMDPPFETFGEVVPMFTMIFEGIQLMHESHVAHHDCTELNFVMDASSMYPDGFHAMDINRTRDWKGRPKHLTRTQARPRYYIIDYGLSALLRPEDGPPLILATPGGDKSVPEFNNPGLKVPVNPFPIDVYYLGNMIRTLFISKYHGFGFMKALITDMTQADPAARPTMDDVVARFAVIRAGLGSRKLRGRLVRRWEFYPFHFLRNIGHLYKTTTYILGGLPAMADPE